MPTKISVHLSAPEGFCLFSTVLQTSLLERFSCGKFKVIPSGAHSNCAHTLYSKSSKSHLIKFAGTDSSNNKRNDLLIVGLFARSHLLSLKHVSTFLLYLLHLLVLLHWSLLGGGRAGCCELNRDKPYFQFYV